MEPSFEFKKIILNNDDEEREILEQFLIRLQLRYETLQKTEKPDFILELDGFKFGFEITKYYSDKKKKGSNSFKFLKDWVSFIKDLRDKINEVDEKCKYYYGAIFFKNQINSFKNFDKRTFLNGLSNELKKINLEQGEKRTITKDEFESKYLRETLEYIYMENTYPMGNPMWWLSSLQTGIVNIDYEKLNEIIEKKETKALKYNKELNSKYLLIYSPGLGLNDILIIKDEDKPYVSEVQRQGPVMVYGLSKDKTKNILSKKNIKINNEVNYFDRIYTFDHFTETIWEIYPKVRQVFDYGKRTIWLDRLPMILK